jgi:glycosyltransferase involved in cell wall biosynthesis
MTTPREVRDAAADWAARPATAADWAARPATAAAEAAGMAASAGGPVRVLHVITHFSDIGGAEVSLVQSLPWLQDAGLRNAVQPISAKSSRHRAELERRGVVIFPAAGDRLAGRVGAVRRAIREFRPDIVHTSMWDADLAGRIAARLERVPVVAGLINAPYSRPAYAVARRPAWLRAHQLLDAQLGRRATTAFHALSGYTADEAVRALGIDRERVFLVPRGRDRVLLGEPGPARRAAVRTALGIGPDHPVVLNTARHEPQKQLELAMAALAPVAERYPDVVVLQAGREGTATARLTDAVARYGLTGRVRLLGSRGDVPDLLAAADAFLLSSAYEGLGGAVVEAMAMEVPVVSFAIPPVAESTGGAALLVPPGDVDALGRALAGLLDDAPARAGLAAAARERFESTYAMPIVAARMAELYRTVADRSGRSGRAAAGTGAR